MRDKDKEIGLEIENRDRGIRLEKERLKIRQRIVGEKTKKEEEKT